jgi:hypothetical protein
MISKEMGSIDTGVKNGDGDLHPLYEEVETLSGTKLYLNRVGGFLVKDRPHALQWPPGGSLSFSNRLKSFCVIN